MARFSILPACRGSLPLLTRSTMKAVDRVFDIMQKLDAIPRHSCARSSWSH